MKLLRVSILLFSMLIVSYSVKAMENYRVYSDSSGILYLEAPKVFVLIAAEISIPLLIGKKNSYLKLTRQGSIWIVEVIPENVWKQLSLSVGHYLVSSSQMYGDDSVLLTLNGNSFPALVVSGFNTTPSYRLANKDGSTYTPPNRQVIFIHTDSLGSPAAETTSSGLLNK